VHDEGSAEVEVARGVVGGVEERVEVEAQRGEGDAGDGQGGGESQVGAWGVVRVEGGLGLEVDSGGKLILPASLGLGPTPGFLLRL
jgi:hypothetical protein